MLTNKNIIDRLKHNFPKGCRVKLLKMNDPQAPAAGTLGTVTYIDDIGTIHVSWDTGSSLGIAYGEDECVRVE